MKRMWKRVRRTWKRRWRVKLRTKMNQIQSNAGNLQDKAVPYNTTHLRKINMKQKMTRKKLKLHSTSNQLTATCIIPKKKRMIQSFKSKIFLSAVTIAQNLVHKKKKIKRLGCSL